MRMLLATTALLLAGCGGGGVDDITPPITMEWDRPSYTITLPDPIVNANVRMGGRDLPPILGVGLSSDNANGPTGVVFMNSLKLVPVRLVAPPNAAGTGYATGTYTVTATATVNNIQYRATTTVVVQ